MKIVYFTKTALSGMIDAFRGILRVVAAFAHAHTNTGRDVACRVSTTMTTNSLLKRLRVGILLCGLICAASLNAQTWNIGSPNAADVTATLSDGTLTISGTGMMANWSSSNMPDVGNVTTAPWREYYASITTVIIGDGVTSIGSFAFAYCSALTSLTIGNGVTTIADYVLNGCSSLAFIDVAANNNFFSSADGVLFKKAKTTLIQYPATKQGAYTIPEGVTSIVNRAFVGCSALTSVIIPEGVTSIGGPLFQNCINLTSIIIPESVTSIGENAFYGCRSLTSIIIPEGVTIINFGVFQNCSDLTSVIIPEGVTSIGVNAFLGCSSLTSVVIPESVTSIGDAAFQNCSNLTSVVIPEGVTSIGSRTFINCHALTSVIIPKSVTSIGENAFVSCRGLTSVTVYWDEPLDINRNVFNDCQPNYVLLLVPQGSETVYSEADVWKEFYIEGISELTLTGSCGMNLTWTYDMMTATLTINGTGEMTNYYRYTLPWYTFRNKIQTFVLSDEMTTIGDRAFYDCSNLRSVNIPESVTSIGIEAFYNCSSLTSIIIPEGVTSIGDLAFYECTGFTSITNLSVEPQNISADVFQSVNIANLPLYVRAASVDLYKDADVWKDFGSIEALKFTVTFDSQEGSDVPQQAIEEGDNAVQPSNPEREDYTFGGWFKEADCINQWNFPTDVVTEDITLYAKWIDSIITTYTVTFDSQGGSGVTSQIVIQGETVKQPATAHPEGYLLGGWYKEEDFINQWNFAADEVTEDMTLYAKWIEDVIYSGTTGQCIWWITGIEGNYTLNIGGAGEMADYNYNNAAPWYDYRASIQTVNIGRGVTNIGDYAFYYCSSLTSVVIPEGATSIGTSAFSWCSSLTSVIIPESVTSIGDHAFWGCSGLTSIIIPESVASIGEYAFRYCSSLTSVTVYWDEPLEINSNVFEGCQQNYVLLIVPQDSETAYSEAEVWNEFNIEGISELMLTGLCGDDLIWTYDIASGTLTISGTGDMTDYSMESVPWFDFRIKIRTLVLSDEMTSIGGSAFYGCTGLTSVIIPDGVTSIGYSAFESCLGLTSVTIPNSVTNIDNGAFYSCRGLTSVYIPENVINIGSAAFVWCMGLTSIEVAEDNPRYTSEDGILFNKNKTTLIQYPASKQGASYTIPESVTTIGDAAFIGCTGLAFIIIPDGVISIEVRAFQGCSSLTSIIIPEGVTSIDIDAFNGCRSLTSVIIPEGVTSIGLNAFSLCTSLSSIIIPNNVTSIGNSVFSSCTSLTSVTNLSVVPQVISADVFFNVIISNLILYVPSESVELYKNAEVWKDFGSIVATSVVTRYTVAFNTQGGSSVSPQSVEEGGKVTQPANPERGNYTFGGWYKEAACINIWNFATDAVIDNVTLYAKWIDSSITTYTVTFASQGGSAVNSQTVEDGGKAAQPADPEREGYTFEGWYKETTFTNQWNFATDEVTEDITLYARWASVTSVISVSVTPGSVSVRKGATQQFSASVEASDGVAQTVTWSVNSTISSISAAGLLTVSTNETATTLTVTATSTVDNTKSGSATVTITQDGTVTVSGTIAGVQAGTRVELYVNPTIKSNVPAGYAFVEYTLTDANGGYLFANLPQGVYIVIVVMEGYDSQPSDPINLTGSGATNGSANFTVNESAKSITPTTSNKPTNTELLETDNPLRAWVRNGMLHITGVSIDEPLSIYSSSGALVYQSKPQSEEIDVNLTVQGVYIIRSGMNTIRVVIN